MDMVRFLRVKQKTPPGSCLGDGTGIYSVPVGSGSQLTSFCSLWRVYFQNEEREAMERKNAAATPSVIRRSNAGGREQGTPVSAYREPLLRALIELGGSAHKNDVLDRVGTIMKNTLQEVDYAYTRKVYCGEHIRWPQNAAWQRHKMVEEGLLKSDSPKGVLDITEAGRSAFS